MRIFLSYASEDKDSAEQLYLALIAPGHQVFFDRATLPPGGDFNSRIRQAVRKSDLLIFLISPHSVAPSSYALTELRFARDKWPHPLKSVLPVMLRETEFGSIPNYLKAITVFEPQGNVVAEVVDWVRQEETLAQRCMRYITNNRILLGLSLMAVITVLVVSIMNRTLITTPSIEPAPQVESRETNLRNAPETEAPKVAQNTLYNRGVSNMQAGRCDLAIDDFTSVIIGNPNHSNAYYNRAVCYQKTGQVDKAIDDFNKVLELSNDTNLKERAKYILNLMSAVSTAKALTDKALTDFALSITVPSTTNSGVELPVPYSGDCTVQYVKGGYKLNARNSNRWSTAIIIFKNLKDPEEKWIGNSPNTNSKHTVAIIGGTGSLEEVEKAARGIKTEVGRLKETDTLTFMAMDGKTSYSDNEGEVELKLSCVPR